MYMQLDTSEVQAAVADYLRKRGVIVERAEQIQLFVVNQSGARMSIAGCEPVVVAVNVKLPEAPYR